MKKEITIKKSFIRYLVINIISSFISLLFILHFGHFYKNTEYANGLGLIEKGRCIFCSPFKTCDIKFKIECNDLLYNERLYGYYLPQLFDYDNLKYLLLISPLVFCFQFLLSDFKIKLVD